MYSWDSLQAPVRSARSISMLALNSAGVNKLSSAQIVRQGWIKPPKDFVNLNVDAAVDEDTGSGWTCIIVRDHHVVPGIGGSWNLPFVDDASSG